MNAKAGSRRPRLEFADHDINNTSTSDSAWTLDVQVVDERQMLRSRVRPRKRRCLCRVVSIDDRRNCFHDKQSIGFFGAKCLDNVPMIRY